ncbi:MAG TPA: hypothetical protein P5567_03915 [Kiritimatiellia bacterium]|nr:hypothetical protein [Kiritimatiellia bacterium]HRZ11583.1 hypothetical protein [Kiritimatiellia bacterium]HSA16866.1 hypothetical protein [Kiritimatiellia bacterium]
MNLRSGAAWGLAAWAAAGGLAVLTAATRLPYSYDEVSAAHCVWLVSGGATPYADFAVNHPPFYWYLLAPWSRWLPPDARALAVYRAVAIAGRGLFLAFLAGLACRGLDRGARPWAALGIAVVAVSAPALDYLVKFSPDAISNALLFGALLFLARPGVRPAAAWFAGGFVILVSLLSNIKYGVFALLIGPVALAADLRRGGRPWKPAFWLLAGTAAALVFACASLRFAGIEPGWAWDMVFRYNAFRERLAMARGGLRLELLRHPLLLLYAGAGLAAWLADAARARRLEPLLLAALGFLAASAATVSRPYSQYLGTWFLLAALFPARAWAPRLARGRGAWRALVLLLALAVPLQAAWHYSRPGLRRAREEQQAVFRFMEAATPRDGFVIAHMAYHPVCRSNTFYKFSADMDGREDAYDRVAAAIPGFRPADRFTPAQYARDLERHPPAVIFEGFVRAGRLEGGPYMTAAQAEALGRFLQERAAEYEYLEVSSPRHPEWPPFVVTRRRTPPPP